nr:MAG TPA: hypothetical protein [Caudoviricetes sp.]
MAYSTFIVNKIITITSSTPPPFMFFRDFLKPFIKVINLANCKPWSSQTSICDNLT